MSVHWTEELATGVEEIDEQHRELYAAVASLHDSMKQGRLDRIGGVVEYLARYAADHFATEERHMAERRYPRLAEHRALHETFVGAFLVRKAAFQSNGFRPSLVVELSEWLATWLGDHVRKVDGEMGRFFRSQAAGRSSIPPRPVDSFRSER